MAVRRSVILAAAGLLCWASLAVAASCGGSEASPTPTPVLASPTPAVTPTVAPSATAQVTATRAAQSPSPAAATATTGAPTPTTAASPTAIPPTATATKPAATPTPTATTAPATATATPQPTATPTPAPFRITGVNYPASVVSGGAKGSLTVSWSGQPKFPVTMVYQMYSCPPDANCTNPMMTFNTPANPLVFPEAVWCYGFTQTVTFGYRVVLIDADDKATNAWDAPFTCTPP